MAKSTWSWDASNMTWVLVSGPGNPSGSPQAGDSAIINNATITTPIDTTLQANTIDLLGTAGLNFIGTSNINWTNSTVDGPSIITNAASIDPATTLNTSGTFVNDGTIISAGTAGSSFVINIATNGAAPGFFMNYGDIEADAGNSLTISVGATSELFNVGLINANGGSILITGSNAIDGGYAPVAGLAVIEHGGTLELNTGYPSGTSGTAPFFAFAPDGSTGNMLKLDQAKQFGGRILGFAVGDTIDIGRSLTVGTVVAFSDGRVALENKAGTILQEFVFVTGAFTAGTFAVVNGIADGFTITTGSDNKTWLTTDSTINLWNNSSGNWQTASSWSTGTIAGAADTPVIGSGATSPFTVTTGATPVTVDSLTLASNNATLRITSPTSVGVGAPFAPVGSLVPGIIEDIAGTIEITAGNTLLGEQLRQFTAGASLVVDSGGTLDLVGHDNLGLGNAGTVIVSSGNSVALFVNGFGLVDGGLINAGPGSGQVGGLVAVGQNSQATPGTLTVQNGGTVIDTYALVSSDPTSFGELIITGSLTTWNDAGDPTDTTNTRGNMLVGSNNQSSNSPIPPFTNNAQLIVENGAVLDEATYAIIGVNPDTGGSATIQSGGIWNIGTSATGGFLNVGNSIASSGTLSVIGGTVNILNGTGTMTFGGITTSNNLGVAIGHNAGSTGTVTVGAGGVLTDAAGNFRVGQSGAGTLDVLTGGLVSVSGSLGAGFNVGFGAGANGAVVINGGTLVESGGFFGVGNANATGTLLVANGGQLTTTNSGPAGDITATGTGTAAATITGGTWTVNGQLIVGDTGAGSLDVNSNGLVNAGTNFVSIGNQSGGDGTISVETGGTLIAGVLAVSNSFGGGSSATLLVGADGTVEANSINERAGGTISVLGGHVTAHNGMQIGIDGTGAIMTIGSLGEVSNTSTFGAFLIGSGITSTAHGTVTVNAGGSLSSTAGLFVGGGGMGGSEGLLIINGGSVTNAGGFTIGQTGGGTVIVDGGGSITTDSGTLFAAMSVGGVDGALLSINHGIVSDSGGSFGLGGTNQSGTLVIGVAGTLVSTTTHVFGGAAFIDSSGVGVATATVSGIGAVWDLSGSVVVANSGTGSLDINTNGVVNAGTNMILVGSGSLGVGRISVESGGILTAGSIWLDSSFAQDATGLLTIGSGGTVQVTAATVSQGGSIVLGGGLLDPSSVMVNGGGIVTGFGVLDAAVNNFGSLTASGGELEITGSVTGSGAESIATGATLFAAADVSGGQTVTFVTNSGELQIAPSGFAATIAGMQSGDIIAITGVTDATEANLLAGDTLQVVRASNPSIDLKLSGFFQGDFFHVNTIGGNAVITENTTPCYLAGSSILTDHGEVAVEDLTIGDRVVTLDGTAKPIKWIGRRSYSGAIPAGLRDVLPIQIDRGALGDQLPRRDLIVSPLHALYFDGVLVPAEHLVNGVTIRRRPDIDPIRYFHIELEQHDVIFAEGAPAETFVDCDSRAMFHNAAEHSALYPGDASPRWRFCFPRVDGGERLATIKRRLDDLAGIGPPSPDTAHGRLQGRLDGVEAGRVSGWAFEPDRPHEAVWLEVLDGDGVIARVHARRYRADLEATGIGDGRYGFELHLTGPMGTRREIRVRRVTDGTELAGSPLVLEPRRADALLEDARRVVATAMLDSSDPASLDALAAELLQGVDALRQARTRQASATRTTLGRGKQQPRALIVDAMLPRPNHDGGSQALLSHAASLTSLGYQVEFVASHELARADEAAETLEALGYRVHRAPQVASVEEVLRRHRNGFELVYLHRLALAEAYAPLARTWQGRARLIYSVADLHHVRLARQASVQASEELAVEASATRMREITAMRLCDAVITHSTVEAAYLARIAPSASVFVVPFVSAVQPCAVPLGARSGLAFIGSWSHAPNADAARWLVTEIMPRVWQQAPGLELFIVGSDWPISVPWVTDQRVRLMGRVTSIEALLAMVRLTVAPLRFGAGLKGKVLDSFAAEVPCVMTTVAAEGLPLDAVLSGLVGDDAASLADLIVRAHDQPAFNRATASAGLTVLNRHFSAAAIKHAMASAVDRAAAATAVAIQPAL